MSSGYIMLVSRKRAWRRFCSVTSKRSAMPGRYHTGSTATCGHTVEKAGGHVRAAAWDEGGACTAPLRTLLFN